LLRQENESERSLPTIRSRQFPAALENWKTGNDGEKEAALASAWSANAGVGEDRKQ
jgi:hypothetical protein